jgi:hypothetical protein
MNFHHLTYQLSTHILCQTVHNSQLFVIIMKIELVKGGDIVSKMRWNFTDMQADPAEGIIAKALSIILNSKIDVSLLRHHGMPNFFSFRYSVARLT